MSNWQTVFKTTNPHQAEIVKAVLADNQIQSVVVNKKDSSYTFLGSIELRVDGDQVMKAIRIIEEDINFD